MGNSALHGSVARPLPLDIVAHIDRAALGGGEAQRDKVVALHLMRAAVALGGRNGQLDLPRVVVEPVSWLRKMRWVRGGSL